jgi:LytS/YehU family sensor histidine kinase
LLKKKWLASILLFPLFFICYDLYQKLCYFLIINYISFLSPQYIGSLKKTLPDNIFEPIANFGYTIFTFLPAFALVMFKKLYEKNKEMQDLYYNNIKLELENLKSQIQPHFFFNTLNDLYVLSLQNSPKAPKIIEGLSNIMRYVLYETQQKVSLIKEIKFINEYFELEKIKHAKSDLVDFKVQGNIEGIEIEPLLFLPLIENCFKNIGEHSAKIILAIDEDELIFQTNSMLTDKMLDKEGEVSMENIKKRLKLLYGEKQRLDITSDQDQFIVTVTIQL